MSQQFVFANNVQTTLAAPITSASQTSIQLASSANFPTIPPGYYWPLTLNDAATQSFFEIVYVTGYSGNTVTVLRGQENTAARTWSTNDLAYSAATAGALASFLSAGNANFVQLSPAAQQSGSINVSGGITAGGAGTFGGGVYVGGALTGATNGGFSGDVSCQDLGLARNYGNTPLGGLPLRMYGASGNIIGVGPSSGLSVNGITASALAIGASLTGKFLAIDINGNVGIAGQLYGSYINANTELVSPLIVQNGRQVLDQITSSTLAITPNGHSVEIEIASSGQVPVGSAFVNDGNGGDPYISLPNYGSWFIETFYAFNQSNNGNLTISFYLSSGTMTGGFLANADASTAFNAVKWISLYGKGHTTVNNQTLGWTLSVSGGSLDSYNQPWTVRATRTA